eukprot:gnl/Dysnectes_brevis/2955_a3633_650.p1 GENE.gnl/Dysnectes_brevis/2955_a3633_650~~gnl/Dysnectes_brevis/2955_a3633_650.p1  ORF type:complete len:971 (+),score=274.54 gnl/Dysnectes_brevis/2955_a3633_650:74-2986(+)
MIYLLTFIVLLTAIYCEETILRPTEGQYQQAGYSVSTDGEWLGLGAIETDYGSVYMYSLVNDEWVLHSTVEAPLSILPFSFVYDFGYSVSISNDCMAVGTPSMDYDKQSFAGLVIIYRFNHTADEWQVEDLIYSPVPTHYEYFGNAVALHEDTLVIGSIQDAYHTQYSAKHGTWDEAELIDVSTVSFKMTSVSISYPWLAVTGPLDSEIGTVCLFDLSHRRWYDRTPITIQSPDPQTNARFGYAVSLALDSSEDAGRMAVGETNWDDTTADVESAGRVHVYTYDGSAWFLESTITGTSPGGSLGIAVVIYDGYLAYSLDNYQRVRLALHDEGYGWEIEGGKYEPELRETTNFGHSLAISSLTMQLVIGSPNAYTTETPIARDAGAAYLEDLPPLVPIPSCLYPMVSMPTPIGICQPLVITATLVDEQGSVFSALDLSSRFAVTWEGEEAPATVCFQEDGSYRLTVDTPSIPGDYAVEVIFNNVSAGSVTVTLQADIITTPVRLPKFVLPGEVFPVKVQPRSYCGGLIMDSTVSISVSSGDSAVASAANDFTVGLSIPQTGLHFVTAQGPGLETWTSSITVTSNPTLPSLLQPTSSSSAEVGYSLAEDGNWLVVGGPYKDGSKGSAYIYQYVTYGDGDEGTWVEHTEIIGSDIRDDAMLFGCSVAVRGDRAAVGASYYTQDTSVPSQGAVYTFLYDVGTDSWSLEQKLVENSPKKNDDLGSYLVMRDDLIVTSGSRYMFYTTYSDGKWDSFKRFTAIDGLDLSFSTLSISYPWLVAGAYLSDSPDTDSGAVVVFDLTAPSFWQYTPAQIIRSPSPQQQAGFGCDVSLDGAGAGAGGVPRMAVGEYHWVNAAGSPVGRAHVLAFNGTGWDLETTFTGDDLDIELGTHVAIDGDLLAVTHENQAAVTVYSLDKDQWVELYAFYPELDESSYYFGNDLVFSHSHILIGSPYTSYVNQDESVGSTKAGSVYVEQL